MAFTFRDVGGQVHVRLFPVRRFGVDNVQGFAEAEFEPIGIRTPAEKRAEKRYRCLSPKIAVHFLAESGRVMAFREAD